MNTEEIRLAEEKIGYVGTRNLDEIIVSEHSIERYVERFKGIEDRATQGVYVAQHKDEIKDFIKRTFQYAELIYIGNLGKTSEINYYFLNGDIALIYDPDRKCIITIFRIKFDVPDADISGAIIESYRKAIVDKQEDLLELSKEYNKVYTLSNSVIEYNNTQIAELQEQIKILEEENSIREQQYSIINRKMKQNKQSMKGLANKLFGMSDFKLL